MDKSARGAAYIAVAAFIALCAYLGAFLWREVTDAEKTAVLTAGRVSVSASLECIAVREEEVVSSSSFAAADGERISAAENTFSHRSALYSAECDGFEYISPDSIELDAISALLSAKPEKHSGCGKLIYSHAWYIAAKTDTPIPAGKSCRLSIGGEDTPISVTTVRSGGQFVLLRTADGLEAHAGLRHFSASLVLEELEGLSVPAEAVYTEDGKSFIYISSGGMAEKKYVDILYAGEGTYLITGSDSGDNFLAENTIAVFGENIYDGKVLG